jgi:hypothetical protein
MLSFFLSISPFLSFFLSFLVAVFQAVGLPQPLSVDYGVVARVQEE